MLGDSININNINCSSENFLLKPLKIATFGPNLYKKRGQYGPHPKQIFFFSEMTKADHKPLLLSRGKQLHVHTPLHVPNDQDMWLFALKITFLLINLL